MTDREWQRETSLGPQIPDAEVAGMVRMLYRDQINHEFVCTLARDRIRVLMAEKTELENQNAWTPRDKERPIKDVVYDIVIEAQGEAGRVTDVMYDDERNCFYYYNHEDKKIEADFMYVTHYKLAETLPPS